MRNLIVGLGKSGLAAARLLLKKHEQVLGYDAKKTSAPFPITKKIDLTKIDRIILSPGVDPRVSWLKKARDQGIAIVGEVELGLREIQGTVIGITGTNGKTTTCLTLEHFLRKSGRICQTLGNIGKPLCAYVLEENSRDGVLIVELSSFQLETAETKALLYAAITNISPNHLDRYDSYDDYKDAKFRIASLLQDEGKLVVGSSLKTHFPQALDGGISTFSLAKTLAEQLGCTRFSLEGFQAPEHRLEYVRTWKERDFYNDSKSTSPAATIYAVNILQKPIILLCGGSEKKLDYTLWKTAFAGMVKIIITIGICGKKMAKTLRTDYLVYETASLDQAFIQALHVAKKGDVILLSPGTASFDAFNNFEERGKAFKDMVHNL